MLLFIVRNKVSSEKKRFVTIPHRQGKEKLLCEFNKIHRRHGTHCMIIMI